MRLIVPILLNALLVFAVYLLDKYTGFKKLNRITKQIIIGILFGAVSCFASGFGVELLGTVVNVRDAAPISAGLIFGAPAGIISGTIGGAYRWFSVYWGGGMYTRVACTIATILAGLLAAGLRKLMFDDKKPTWGYGVCITVVCEVIHMLLIFLTNMDNSSDAFNFVREASWPMIIGNAVAVGASIMIVSLLSHERLTINRKGERIAQTFQRWLLLCIVIAYLITTAFTYSLQNNMAQIETNSVITTAIDDAYNDIMDASDENLLWIARNVKNEYLASTKDANALKTLAEKYSISEVNIIDTDGIIVLSSVDEYINYDMASGDQSREFLVLLSSKEEFVQEYRQTSYSEAFYRKYAGVAFEDGGFIQVGYDPKEFQKDISDSIIDAIKNRHVGQSGFLAVGDERLGILSENEYSGRNLCEIGIDIDTETMEERKVYKTKVMEEPYLFAYTVAEGFYIVGAMPASEAMFMRDASLYTSIFMQVIIFAALFVFIYVLIKRVIINNMTKVNDTLAQITGGNLNVTVDVRTNAEFASLSDDINSTVNTLKRYIAEASARIDRELEYAKQIQLSALPTKFPDNENYSVIASMQAAKEVGGDFYDFYELDDHTVAILVADVSGKGIPAAMFMMTAKTIIKDLAERGLPVNEVFTEANKKLCENNESDMFVTAWMGMLDLRTGILKYANAGHNPPLIMREGGDFEYLRSRAGFVLAGMDGVRYRINELTLSPGDRVFLYTDGVSEATDTAEQLYGEDRLLEYMNKAKKAKPRDVLKGLKADIDSFVGEAPQFDDITMLELDYKKGMEE